MTILLQCHMVIFIDISIGRYISYVHVTYIQFVHNVNNESIGVNENHTVLHSWRLYNKKNQSDIMFRTKIKTMYTQRELTLNYITSVFGLSII